MSEDNELWIRSMHEDSGSPIGMVISDYRISHRIRAEGYGTTYLAKHERLGTPVSIMFLQKQFFGENLSQFVEAAGKVARISHPNLEQILNVVDSPNGEFYVLTEFLQGETLADRINRERGTLRLPLVLQIGIQITNALEAIHEAGLVAGDVKPSKVFLVETRDANAEVHAKLFDLSLAVCLSLQREVQPDKVIGTAAYMSPESFEGAFALSEKSDVYSLGLLLFEAIVGKGPYASPNSPGAWAATHLFSDPHRLRDRAPSAPVALDQLLGAMLEKNPNLRPSTKVVGERLRVLLDTELRKTSKLGSTVQWVGKPLRLWLDAMLQRAPALRPSAKEVGEVLRALSAPQQMTPLNLMIAALRAVWSQDWLRHIDALSVRMAVGVGCILGLLLVLVLPGTVLGACLAVVIIGGLVVFGLSGRVVVAREVPPTPPKAEK